MPLRGEVLCKQSEQARAKRTIVIATEKSDVQTAEPRDTSLLACRDLREAPEHPLDLWSLLKSVATKRTERKKAAQKGTHARQKKEQFFVFVHLIVLWLTP